MNALTQYIVMSEVNTLDSNQTEDIEMTTNRSLHNNTSGPEAFRYYWTFQQYVMDFATKQKIGAVDDISEDGKIIIVLSDRTRIEIDGTKIEHSKPWFCPVPTATPGLEGIKEIYVRKHK